MIRIIYSDAPITAQPSPDGIWHKKGDSMDWIELGQWVGNPALMAALEKEVVETSGYRLEAFDDLFACLDCPDAEIESISGALVDGGGESQAWDSTGEIRWIGTPAQTGVDHTAPGARWDDPAVGRWERPPVVVIHRSWDTINGGRRWTKIWTAKLAVAVAGANAVMRSQAASRRDSDQELRNSVWRILDAAYAANENPLPLMRKTFDGHWAFLKSMPVKPQNYKYSWGETVFQDTVFFVLAGGVVACACNKIQGRVIVEKFGEKQYMI